MIRHTSCLLFGPLPIIPTEKMYMDTNISRLNFQLITNGTLKNYYEKLYSLLEESICSCKSKNISFSGGLDSSIIAYLLKDKGVKGLTVIAKDFLATDLTYCQLASKQFGIPLDISSVDTLDLLSAVDETIKILKVFNDIEIRNSAVLYLSLSSIKNGGKNGIITGDGADELFAGYNFFLKKDDIELEKDLKRIWDSMHYPSKAIGKYLGIEVETPFLDDEIVNFAKTTPINTKVGIKNNKKYGKWILRKTFEGKIPDSIVWRDKSAMQDGAGTTGLTNLFETLIPDEVFREKSASFLKSDNVTIRTKESLHYYEIYKKYHPTPNKLHTCDTKCPFCQYKIETGSKFCRMCGSFPI